MSYHIWKLDEALNEWTYTFLDSEGFEWHLRLEPWYESLDGPWEAHLEYGEKSIPLRFPHSYTDTDLKQLKEDALRRAMELFPSVDFPEKR